MLGIMDVEGRRRRLNREWIDDIREWYKQDLYSLTIGLHKNDDDCRNK